jgi:hypothetical protein
MRILKRNETIIIQNPEDIQSHKTLAIRNLRFTFLEHPGPETFQYPEKFVNL